MKGHSRLVILNGFVFVNLVKTLVYLQ